MDHLKNYHRRNINGIILLDKPLGVSSNNLLQKVKRLFYANKAGHTGSLDPLATGMLPICFGEATKFSQYLLEADKSYLVTARLGERTNTSDADGQIISTRPVLLDQVHLETELKYIIGEKLQVPPMFSALKYYGRPLYEYARKGIKVKRKARYIHIYDVKLHYWDMKELKLEIHCSKGTYIRTIIDDLGERLGCGAHVTALRRLTVSCYKTKSMVTLAALQKITAAAPKTLETLELLDALLLPIDSALVKMPFINLSSDIAARLRLGQKVTITSQLKTGLVRLIESNNSKCFFGVGKIIKPGCLVPHRLIMESYA